MSPRAFFRLFVALVCACGGARAAHAQQWSADVSAGRIVYAPVSPSIGSSNLLTTIRYDAVRQTWVSATAAAPFQQSDPIWGSLAGGGRLMPAGASARLASAGVDASANGFLFKDRVTQQSGTGATSSALPFIRLSAGPGFMEVRGGWRGYRLSYQGASQSRNVLETGARVGYGTTLQVGADTYVVRATEGTYPFAGVSLAYGGPTVQTWVRAGRWLNDALVDPTAWDAGAATALGSRSTVWAAVRQDAPDPLYWNLSRRSWSVGVTNRLGRPRLRAVTSPASRAGDVAIRISAGESSTDAVSIAGDFNNWQPTPMQREGNQWVIRLPLAAGIYQYAFRSANGDWFVPDSVAGRRDDGMGGHVAVLVVS